MNGMATNSHRATSKDEARVQFIHGKELSGLYSFTDGYTWLGGYDRRFNTGRRLQNVTEAIKAFEAALFLDPDFDEAKIYLAVCLASPDIEKPDLARDYYHEVFAGSTNETLVEFARTNLVKFYTGRNDQAALALLSAQAKTNPVLQEMKAKAERVGKPVQSLPLAERTSAEKALEVRQKILFADCEADQSALKSGSPILIYGRLHKEFNEIYAILNHNTNDTRRYVDRLLPEMAKKFPSLEIYVLGTYLVWAQEASPANRSRLEQLLDEMAKQPEKVQAQKAANRAFFEGIAETSTSAKLYGLARKAGTLFRTVVHEKTPPTTISRINVYLAYGDREEGHWQKAREAFEALGKLEMRLDMPGPWGKAPFYFRAEYVAYDCRQHLGIAGPPPAPPTKPKTEPPAQFSLNKPVLTLERPFLFVCDGEEIWLADGLLSFVWAKSGGKFTYVELPAAIERTITCISPCEKTIR